MTPEFELLCACAQSAAGAGESGGSLAGQAAGVADWSAFLRLAAGHRLAPIVHARLSRAADVPVPDAVLGALRDRARAAAARSALLADEMLALLALFEERSLWAMPCKGPVLAALAYADPALREFDDLDFLVHPSDLRAARAALVAAGYRPVIDVSEGGAEAQLRGGWGFDFASPRGKHWIEIGAEVTPRYFRCRMGADRLRSDPQTALLNGRAVRTLSAENTLLVALVRGAWHSWTRLNWLVDAGALLARGGVEPERLLRSATELGARRIAVSGLALLQLVLAVPLPRPFEAAIAADLAAGRLALELSRSLAEAPWRRPTRGDIVRLHLAARERLRDRLGYIALLAALPGYRDWTAVRLPRRLFPLYAVIRPLRLIGAAAGARKKEQPALRRAVEGKRVVGDRRG